MIGVLELVDQDVPIPTALPGEDRRVVPQQAQRQADLVPEVDPVGGTHQPLIHDVRGSELRLLRSLLFQGVVI